MMLHRINLNKTDSKSYSNENVKEMNGKVSDCFDLTHKQSFFFFLNDPPTPEISPLPLHAALPISGLRRHCLEQRLPAEQRQGHEWHGEEPQERDQPQPVARGVGIQWQPAGQQHAHRPREQQHRQDRKSTRLNSSHLVISYAVFCLK